MDPRKSKFLGRQLLRSGRLFRHIFLPANDPYLSGLIKSKKLLLFAAHYIAEIPILFFDIIGLPELFAFLQALTKKNARPLNAHELNLAKSIFNKAISFAKVRIDEQSRVGTHRGKYAFVSYYYINSLGVLSLPILMHELVHVLQFEQSGSPYALRNMVAHIFPKTYDYGGLEKIQSINNDPSEVHSLNYEQRADIFSDYCLLLMGYKPEWGHADASHIDMYYSVVQLLLADKRPDPSA